ncbi:uncharacterized protein V1518DRAFT_409207 [Limtongia smithiae]|uniref:uncharacterized protein n=1 Tax=Limtongia smithiae TaxID=1125753 RepID=UPI0034CD0B0F
MRTGTTVPSASQRCLRQQRRQYASFGNNMKFFDMFPQNETAPAGKKKKADKPGDKLAEKPAAAGKKKSTGDPLQAFYFQTLAPTGRRTPPSSSKGPGQAQRISPLTRQTFKDSLTSKIERYKTFQLAKEEQAINKLMERATISVGSKYKGGRFKSGAAMTATTSSGGSFTTSASKKKEEEITWLANDISRLELNDTQVCHLVDMQGEYHSDITVGDSKVLVPPGYTLVRVKEGTTSSPMILRVMSIEGIAMAEATKKKAAAAAAAVAAVEANQVKELPMSWTINDNDLNVQKAHSIRKAFEKHATVIITIGRLREKPVAHARKEEIVKQVSDICLGCGASLWKTESSNGSQMVLTFRTEAAHEKHESDEEREELLQTAESTGA